MNKRQVNILWTGGLDSSFRVIELSQMEVIIQPYYIVDPVRSSIKYELKAIETITDVIRNHPKTKATLLDLKKIYLNQIVVDKEISEAFTRLHDKYVIGHQYDLIARYAEQHNIRFELSIENSDRSKAMCCISNETTLIPFKDDEYSIYRINPDKSSKDGMLVFSNIDLPTSLWNLTKLEEVEQLKRMGHSDTIKHTWFCHFPVFGMPCGHCNPCQDSINEGLSFRVPLKGRILYYFYKPLKSIFNRIKKIL